MSGKSFLYVMPKTTRKIPKPKPKKASKRPPGKYRHCVGYWGADEKHEGSKKRCKEYALNEGVSKHLTAWQKFVAEVRARLGEGVRQSAVFKIASPLYQEFMDQPRQRSVANVRRFLEERQV